MSEQYEGDENEFPEDFTLADDSAPPTMAEMNVGLEANGDRTAYLRRTAANPRFGFSQSVTSLADVGEFLQAAAYDAANALWYLVGNVENIRRSLTNGWSWSTSLGDTPGADENCKALAISPSGAVVVATDTRYVFESAGGVSGSFTKVDVGGTALAAQACGIVYDPVNLLWAWVGVDDDSFCTAKTSPDRTTWTARTSSANMNWNPFLVRMAVNPATGRIVLVQYSPSAPQGERAFVTTSDDGGITWVDGFEMETLIATPTEASLSFNPADESFLYTIGETSGTPSSEVWRSTDDGETWTKLTTLTTMCLMHPAPYGKGWVDNARGGRASSEIIYSDNGTTWKYVGHITNTTTARGCYAGGGQIIAVDGLIVWPSVRAGRPELGTVT